MLVLPSQTNDASNMTSLRSTDGNTSYHAHESFLLDQIIIILHLQAKNDNSSTTSDDQPRNNLSDDDDWGIGKKAQVSGGSL